MIYTPTSLRKDLYQVLQKKDTVKLLYKGQMWTVSPDGVYTTDNKPLDIQRSPATPEVEIPGFELHGDTVTSPSSVVPAVISVDKNNRIIDPANALNLQEERLFEQARQYQEEVDAYDASINQDPEAAFQIERMKRWLDDFWIARMQP